MFVPLIALNILNFEYFCIDFDNCLLGTALPGSRGCDPPWLRLSQNWDHKP